MIWLSIDADLNTGSSITDAPPLFQTMESLFAVFFTFEIGVRIGAFKDKRNCRKDGWTVFDSVFVVMYSTGEDRARYTGRDADG